MKKTVYALVLLLSAWLPACQVRESIEPSERTPFSQVNLDVIPSSTYLASVNYTPEDAQFYDLVNNRLHLTELEIERLSQNGFVVTERLTWERFKDAYAWIYWKDLPVLVTTDSILHAIHQSYDDLLLDLESDVIVPKLKVMLYNTLNQLERDRDLHPNAELLPLFDDVETHLTVAHALLIGRDGEGSRAGQLVQMAETANHVETIELFGRDRYVDFTLFKPRGHYVESEELVHYFRAMAWLANLDFRFVDYDPSSNEPILNQHALAAAAILRNAIEKSGQRENWYQINTLLEAFIGHSDNISLTGLDSLLGDMDSTEPEDVFESDPSDILNQLTQNDYGQQQITGQIIHRTSDNQHPTPVPNPISFMLFGYRFAIDSFVLNELVYDRLWIDDSLVFRALPSPLDVMYSMGNDHALSHLSQELESYQYDQPLAALRHETDTLDSSFWRSSYYNQWLRLIRTLNQPTTSSQYPQAMRTFAWADKILQTQLASWAQLRRDNILYAKQSYTTEYILCEYPSGYVEPYPEFFSALGDLADTVLGALGEVNDQFLFEKPDVLARIEMLFSQVKSVSAQLEALADKELRLEPFTEEEELFVKSVTIQHVTTEDAICGVNTVVSWEGWYPSLFFQDDATPTVIADVHTNPNNDPKSPLYPPRVLHAATGPIAPIVFIVDTDEGPTIYVGPAFTYYEFAEAGFPPNRLTDAEWNARLESDHKPPGPTWTSSFRISTDEQPFELRLPAQ